MLVPLDEDNVEVVRLCIDDADIVWFGCEGIPFASSKCMAGALFKDFKRFPLSAARQFRVVGDTRNARLITGLQDFRRDCPEMAGQQEIIVFSPSAAPGRTAQQVLCALWQQPLPLRAPWYCHSLHKHDYAVYSLLTEIDQHGVSDKAVRLLSYHPAWPALNYLPTLNVMSVCRLLALIVDPRWYIHPLKPDRLSGLYNYLGITPENMEAYVARQQGGRYSDRAGLVVSSWFRSSVHLDKKKLLRPDHFLFRALTAKDLGKALLGACRRFVRFLVLVWLGNMVSFPETEFVPSRFFKSKDESDSFMRHLHEIGV